MGGKYKYKNNDKCKTVGCNFSARVKGYCCNCYQNYQIKNQMAEKLEL